MTFWDNLDTDDYYDIGGDWIDSHDPQEED